MTRHEIIKRGKVLIDQLDGEGISDVDQVLICSSVLVAVLLQLPPAKMVALARAHINTLAALIAERADSR